MNYLVIKPLLVACGLLIKDGRFVARRRASKIETASTMASPSSSSKHFGVSLVAKPRVVIPPTRVRFSHANKSTSRLKIDLRSKIGRCQRVP